MHNTISATPELEGSTVSEYMNLRRRRGSSTMASNKHKRGQRILEAHVYKPVLVDSINDRNGELELIPDT